jgi:hypothetical protein
MNSLSVHDILHVWEMGQDQHPMDRALTLLAVACPKTELNELAELSVGRRDAHLFTLRELTFGSRLNSFAECPQCQGRIEFNLNVADILAANYSAKQEHELSLDGFELRFRPLNSRDLRAVANCDDPSAARSLLIQRCVLQASCDGVMISSIELSEEVIVKLIAHLAECDPQADVLLELACPTCGYSWKLIFDIVSFFWAEISAQAKRLLHEVHSLAMAYGWREADILSMSTARRQFYLEVIS